ncbi:alpha/beta-hydrolase [Xylona heveae TC161]|uniref:Alpha/beta-hydrolase n=1 Tax=Xylona heveae (strain CBS 132557 / TC161) TaxID=1328760 RepID=A0A165HL79_XYLHT|nr:alpha/beta-hydrolase [Xylona heveae TC161]KZF23683.1 alpha/beta-hydrolase [Xylona heveae TC161]
MTVSETVTADTKSKIDAAVQYTRQAERLAHLTPGQEDDRTGATTAKEAIFVTPYDPVIATANGGRLPAVPLLEAEKLNALKDELEGDSIPSKDSLESSTGHHGAEEDEKTKMDGTGELSSKQSTEPGAPLREAVPPSRTNPLFPPLPLYGPPTLLRNLQCFSFRVSSFFLSLSFLGVIVLGAAFTSLPLIFRNTWFRLTFRNPDALRPFHKEECRRKKARREAEKDWKRRQRRRNSQTKMDDNEVDAAQKAAFEPTEGGKDKLICDVGYYARRVGLNVEEFQVQTEDGFILQLWHVYDPKEYQPVPDSDRQEHGPEVFPEGQATQGQKKGASGRQFRDGQRKYPVLLVHGLLQSSGAYCCNDDESLAFYLCKSGYDVWLGNNRCGFRPQHQMLTYSDPRMWAWNIRQMGVMDLPALISRVLSETGFEKLGLICHSQGTTETFVALAKEQRPDLGSKISVFCALAPAAYAGPLIGKMYFKFMRIISPGLFRLIFGIHAFIPFMMKMHSLLPGRLYGALGYRVFSFLFNWTDDRWERDLRDRMFQFAPVYVSAESMRWWLGRECFAKQKCILATREVGQMEENEDEEEAMATETPEENQSSGAGPSAGAPQKDKGRTAWYDEQVPPFAMWIAGSDDLVDGRRLLRRFERGREPYVQLVHAKIIEEYEHLDVIWAMDSIEQVGNEVREVIWKTAPEAARQVCRVPQGCDEVEPWEPSTEPPRVRSSQAIVSKV